MTTQMFQEIYKTYVHEQPILKVIKENQTSNRKIGESPQKVSHFHKLKLLYTKYSNKEQPDYENYITVSCETD